MALEQLAKHPIQYNGVDVTGVWNAKWVDGLGLVAGVAANGVLFKAVVQLDGYVSYVDYSGWYEALWVGVCPDLIGDGVLMVNGYGTSKKVWVSDPEHRLLGDERLLKGTDDLPSTTSYRNSVVRYTDRWIRASTTSVWSAPLDGASDWASEASISPSVGFPPRITPAGSGLMWIIGSDGTAVLYDAENLQAVRSRYFFSSSQVYSSGWGDWSQELDVFVGAFKDQADDKWYLYTLADEVRPTAISDPIALSTLQRGHVTQMQVTVTGDRGEPVEDINVDWTITAGDGELDASQSRTNDSGEAEVGYLPDDLASASFTLEAEVAY